MLGIAKGFISLMQETLKEWGEDQGASIAASLAYYTIFSLSPLLIVVALVLGLILDESSLQQTVIEGARGAVGEGGAELISGIIVNGRANRSDVIGTILWIAFIVWGASGLFTQLQSALNKIWEVKPIPGRSPMAIVRTRLFSFIVLALVGFTLFTVMLLNSGLNSLLIDIDSPAVGVVVRPIQFVITVGLSTLLISAVFKLLPDVIIRWRDVLAGALFTAVLFFVGQFVLGLYLSNANVGSVFGTAGSLTAILVWIYYTMQILLFGAEFTEVWARRHGAYIRPDADATWIDDDRARAELERHDKDVSAIDQEDEKIARIKAMERQRMEMMRGVAKRVVDRVRRDDDDDDAPAAPAPITPPPSTPPASGG